MLYEISDGTVSLGGKVILNHIHFQIKGKEKIALVGKNGAGKTTLLRLIAGELSLDADDKRFSPGVRKEGKIRIGMLRQDLWERKDLTVEEAMAAACPVADPYARERFEYEREYHRLFTGFGFALADCGKRIDAFSGGEQTKIALIRLLLSKPDILLLDEPTNHLDADALRWLEEYLRDYGKAVVTVSHDRYFLDRTAEVVYELEGGTLTKYTGNYTAYREQREKRRALQEKKYRSQQEELARLDALVKRFRTKPRKAAMARSKKKVMERMERIPKPREGAAHRFSEKIFPEHSGNKWVLDADRLSCGCDHPIREVSLRLRRGQKIAVLGANGSGKTTFLKTVIGALPPLSGRLEVGDRVEIGYFAQDSIDLDSEQRVFSWFHDAFPQWTVSDVKKKLADYLFRGEDAGKRICDLSGGEKSRLLLAKLLESRPNFLVLDEPTNHMDIPARETLESAFQAYQGTMLFVTHDRYFIREVAQSLLIFEGDRAVYYPFDYEHYENHLRRQRELAVRGGDARSPMEAENARLVEGLLAVPDRTRMQGASFSTEQSYTDWQLSLAARRLFAAGEALAACETCRAQAAFSDEEGAWTAWEKEHAALAAAFHAECLGWYEKYLEYERAFAHYRDG